MKISYDPAKRAATLHDRAFNFEDAVEVFAGDTLDYPDERFDYGEVRNVTIGHLRGRMVVVVWTARGARRHVISMRKANEREQVRFGQHLEKVDAYVLDPDDYAEIPELTDEWFEKAVAHRNGKPLRRGRPKSASTKQQVTLRIDRDVLDRFRQTGDGWQSRINEALRKAVGV